MTASANERKGFTIKMTNQLLKLKNKTNKLTSFEGTLQKSALTKSTPQSANVCASTSKLP